MANTDKKKTTDNKENKSKAPLRALFKKYAGQGIVKAVLSGDSLVIMGGVKRGQIPREKVLVLSGITAPKCSRSRNQQDEPFGWESREILRRQCIGERVFFTVEYETADDDTGRAFGTVRLVKDDTDLAEFMVSSGFAKVKIGKDGRIPADREQLIKIQRGAKNMALGLHNVNANPQDRTRNVNWFANHRELLDNNRGVAIPAIVDRVRDGHVLQLELLGRSLQHTMLTLHLAGITSPSTPLPYSVKLQQWERDRKSDPKLPKPKKQKPQVGSLEAQFFTEARLLHRNVKVILRAVDKRGNIFGTINFVQGNISEKLVEFGYATVTKWSSQLIGAYDNLKSIEAEAQQKKLGIWKHKKVPADSKAESSVPQQWNGTVEEVVSGDTIVVKPANGEAVRVQFASIRTPRLNARDRSQSEYLATEAREFVRERVIGKTVTVIPEYERSFSSGEGKNKKKVTRTFSTVLLNSADLAQGLVEKGYATVSRHAIDEDRSRRYDILLRVEDRAIKNNVGIYGDSSSKRSSKVVDLSTRDRKKAEEQTDSLNKQGGRSKQSKARSYLNSLKNASPIEAVVEYVVSASRVKVYVPSKNLVLILVLRGIRTPSRKEGKGMEKNDVLVNPELSKAALEYVRERVHQRTVTIDINDVDRGDNFMGHLFTENGKNITASLLEEGLARIVGRYTRSDEKYGKQYGNAEDNAKNSKQGIWLNYVEPTPEETEEAVVEEAPEFKAGEEKVNFLVTEVLDGVSFYARVVGDKNIAAVNEALEELTKDIESGKGEALTEIKKGAIVAGQFRDGQWYRVQIGRRANKEGTEFEVFYIDFGNKSILSQEKLRALPPSLVSKKPLAHFCVLTGCNAPKGDSVYAEGSTDAFGEQVFDQTVTGRIDAQDTERLHVTLTVNDNARSINQSLLEAGQIRVVDRPFSAIDKKYVEKLRGYQEVAMREYVGIWEYGIVSDEEDQDDDAGRVPFNRK